MADEAESLLRNADKALYASKRAGRNRLSIYSEVFGVELNSQLKQQALQTQRSRFFRYSRNDSPNSG